MSDTSGSSSSDSSTIQLSPRSVATRRQPDWKHAFVGEVNELFRKRLRVACTVLMVLHVTAFAVFHGHDTPVGLTLRIGLIPLIGAMLGSTWMPGLGSGLRPLSALMIAAISYYAIWVNNTVGDPLDIRAITLSLVTAGLLFPFTARSVLALSASILAFYFGAAKLSGADSGAELAGGTFFLFGASGLATLAASLSSTLREREFRARFELERANDKTEALLRNMLPAPIVERLKEGDGSVAERHPEATVMFIDIVGFTTMSSAVLPEQLVGFLNQLFSELDALTTAHGLEKIKTIGDAYMVAGGLPAPRDDHAAAVARLALEVRTLVKGFETPDGKPLDVRVGIHSGPVIAGVIGVTKLTYDLWGDTVNTASRMESHGEPGVIQITEATKVCIEGQFRVESRGTVQVKGKGPMNVYALIEPLG